MLIRTVRRIGLRQPEDSRGHWLTIQAKRGHRWGIVTCSTRTIWYTSVELVWANERRLGNCQRIEAWSLKGVLGCLFRFLACCACGVFGCFTRMRKHLDLEWNESGKRHGMALSGNCRGDAWCSNRRPIHPGEHYPDLCSAAFILECKHCGGCVVGAFSEASIEANAFRDELLSIGGVATN